jgi:hypothetical protein
VHTKLDISIVFFIGIKRHNVTSHWHTFSSIRVTMLIPTTALG